MKTKLELAKQRKTRKEQDRADILALTAEIKAFNEILNGKEDIDLSELKTQLTELPELIAEPITKSLGGFLDSFEPYLKKSLEKQKQPDLPGLLKSIKINAPTLDLKPIAKEIAKLKQKAVKQSQQPEDFVPYRRVVKLGNKFFFDDNMTSSGSGGGGANLDTTGLATAGKQDDIITAISGIGGTTYYKTLVDKSTTTDVIYVGKAAIGSATSAAAWQIKKIVKTVADNVTITFGAAGAFTAIWDDRATTVTYT